MQWLGLQSTVLGLGSWMILAASAVAETSANVIPSTIPSTIPSAISQAASPDTIQLPPNTGDRIEQTLPTPLPTTPPPSSTPPIPIQVQDNSPPEAVAPSNRDKIQLDKLETISILGNTVLQPEVQKKLDQFKQIHLGKGKKVTFEDLIKLRSDITQLYLDNGYLNSGAFIPNNQNLQGGNIQIQIVEGELERIEIAGLTHLQESYVRKRLELATTAPLNKSRLERALQLLQIDPLIDQVNAELGAGSSPGRNILRVTLKEAPSFHAGVHLDNGQSNSVGAFQASGFLSHDNLLGFGDRFSFEYGRTAGLNLYGVSYTLPINAKDGTLSLRYSKNDSKIVESIFEDLGIRSNSTTFSVSLRQPLVRSPNTEFAVGVGFDLRRSETFILDNIPFSFSEGPEEGESKVAVVRFFQDWVQRDARQVLAARSQFSVGLNAFGATVNAGDIPDGQFVAWLGQFQWVQQLSPRVVVVSRLAAQFSSDSLLSLERFSFGGADTVRGYRQNQVVADNGVIGSVEARIALTSNPSVLQLTPFIDWGYGWNTATGDTAGAEPDPAFLLSTGVGLKLRLLQGLDAQLDYGIPLITPARLETQRWQFSLRYQPF